MNLVLRRLRHPRRNVKASLFCVSRGITGSYRKCAAEIVYLLLMFVRNLVDLQSTTRHVGTCVVLRVLTVLHTYVTCPFVVHNDFYFTVSRCLIMNKYKTHISTSDEYQCLKASQTNAGQYFCSALVVLHADRTYEVTTDNFSSSNAQHAIWGSPGLNPGSTLFSFYLLPLRQVVHHFTPVSRRCHADDISLCIPEDLSNLSNLEPLHCERLTPEHR